MTASALLETMLCHGWTHVAVFRCPWFVLADWCRDHELETEADAIQTERPGPDSLASRLRDEAYMRGPFDQADEMTLFIRENEEQFRGTQAAVVCRCRLYPDVNPWFGESAFRQTFRREYYGGFDTAPMADHTVTDTFVVRRSGIFRVDTTP
jgi:hypothetical protein